MFVTLAAEAIFSQEKQRQRAGTDVRAGHGLVADGKNILRRVRLPQQRGKCLRLLGAARVRDADGLVLRVHDGARILPRQRGHDGALTAHLGKADDLALAVALEQRLELQNGRDDRFDRRKPALTAALSRAGI